MRRVTSEPDKKLITWIERVCEALGLWEWQISVHMVDRPMEQAICGCINYHFVTKTATISINRHLTGTELYKTLIHELCHLVFARIDNVVEEQIIKFLPERERYNQMYTDALEETVDCFSRTLYDTLLGEDYGQSNQSQNKRPKRCGKKFSLIEFSN